MIYGSIDLLTVKMKARNLRKKGKKLENWPSSSHFITIEMKMKYAELRHSTPILWEKETSNDNKVKKETATTKIVRNVNIVETIMMILLPKEPQR